MCATPTVVIVTVSHWQGGEGDEGHAAVTSRSPSWSRQNIAIPMR